MSKNTQEEKIECSNPECGSNEFMEIGTIGRTGYETEDTEEHYFWHDPEVDKDTHYFECVYCRTKQNADTEDKLLERIYG